jgi:S-adenosylmethionine synthetase
MSERNIRVEEFDRTPVDRQDVEIVERKGIGHPDSICDGIAESVSRRLCQVYLDRVGKVLHHNTDETQLVAGTAAPEFGGGEMVEPIYVLLTGRATREYRGTRIPAERIALQAARDYLAETVPELEFGTDVVVDVRMGEGSGDLQAVFGEDGVQVPRANDTSFGVGHAPLSEVERLVLETERLLQTDEFPAVGPDVKVMGKREDDDVDVTVAAAVVDRHVADLDEYRDVLQRVRTAVDVLADEYTDRDVSVHVNTADDYEEGSVYLTTTGVSAEQGDDGSVGRGNRVNGLITPNRSMSLEAASGKNPVNHIGKIYNLLSQEIARGAVERVDGIADLRVRLLSQIGAPIDQPQVADAHVRTEDGVAVADVEEEVTAVVDEKLADVPAITERVIEGELDTF